MNRRSIFLALSAVGALALIYGLLWWLSEAPGKGPGRAGAMPLSSLKLVYRPTRTPPPTLRPVPTPSPYPSPKTMKPPAKLKAEKPQPKASVMDAIPNAVPTVTAAPVKPIVVEATGSPSPSEAQGYTGSELHVTVSATPLPLPQLPSGVLQYTPPLEPMTVGEPGKFSVNISQNPKDDFKNVTVYGGGKSVTMAIKVGPQMKVKLEGGSDFDVSSYQNDDESQAINIGETHWIWDVTPKRAGTLLLVVKVFVVDRDGDRWYAEKPFDVPVEANLPNEVSTFIREHLEWLWGLLVVPAGAYIKRRWFPSRKRKPH